MAWSRSPRRKPLLVRGARQIGKTWAVLDFGRRAFAAAVHHVDLELRRDAHDAFGDDLTARRVLSALEVRLGARILPGRDLLFLDEIQACPRAITALRYLHEQVPGLHVIAAGSLLDFALRDYSFPVGQIEHLAMYPMTFVEFLEAMGMSVGVEIVRAGPQPQPEPAHAVLLDQLRQYLFVGGMPEAVQAYADTHSLLEAARVQRNLIESYRDDFGKYAPRADKQCMNVVLDSLARGVGQQVKLAPLARGYSDGAIRHAVDVLARARVVTRVPGASPAGLPLGASASGRRFKAIMVDVGLMQRLSGMPLEVEYAKKDLLGIYRGALAEQFVGQELLASLGSQAAGGGIYYWAREAKSSTAEVDYLVASGGRVRPIEVKSGPAGRLRSMRLLLEQHPHCAPGLVLSPAPYAELPEQRLKFVPLYFAGSLAGA
ncbi:MAG: ATP-binding protein [Deltaproteobacteria bacterium]|nr:ATP-binding protein [Deltaproteobacteria bacterium]